MKQVGRLIKQELLWAAETTDAPPPHQEPAALTKRVQARLDAAERAINDRAGDAQDVGYTSRIFGITNLPAKRTPVKIYERRNGRYSLRITTDPDKEIPFGQDRLLILLLATEAIKQQSKHLKLGSARDMLKTLNKADDGRSYKWLAEGLERLFRMTVSWGETGSIPEGGRIIAAARMNIMEQFRLWYAEEEHSTGSAGFENEVTLADSWYEDIRAHGWPVEIKVALSLADRPMVYDLYVTLACRAARIPKGDEVFIPLFGPSGLINQTGSATTHERKFRQTIKSALQTIKGYWPQCPARLSEEGNHLVVKHGYAVLPQPKMKTEDFHVSEGTQSKLLRNRNKRTSKKTS